MLERSVLLLHPWPAFEAGAEAVRVRAIVDSAGAALGSVRHTPPTGPRWLHWFRPQTLEVFETPDNSLVFTLHRSWGWPAGWRVIDADDRHVGTIRGLALLDGFGHFLAVMEPEGDLRRGRFRAMQGNELGEFAVSNKGTSITFAAELEGNPFARMLILAGALVREE